MKILRIGTTNLGKLREFRQMLEPLGYDVRGLEDLPDFDVVEDGETFAANAVKKANALLSRTGEPAIADDSGLAVDYLDGRPGIHSARYAGVSGAGRNAANRTKLLGALEGVPEAERGAHFVCALAYCVPDAEPVIFFGELRGRIGVVERGDNGFGYDPIFIVEDDTRTAAELAPLEKNEISHRGRALRQLLAYLT